MVVDHDGWETRCARAKTDNQKLNATVEFLTESHIDTFGGYPHDGRWIGDIFVWADLDDRKERNQTLLRTRTKKQLLKIFKEAKDWKRRSSPDDMSWLDCFFEADAGIKE